MSVWTASYTIQDGKGETSTTEINFPGTLLAATAAQAAVNFGELIEDMISGSIIRVSLVLGVETDSFNPSPATDSDVEEGARFQFRTSGGFYTALRIPTINESQISPGSQAVNMTMVASVAFVTAMTGGIEIAPGTFVIPCDKRGDEITALSFAREQFLSSR